jgi:hypothetical protein
VTTSRRISKGQDIATKALRHKEDKVIILVPLCLCGRVRNGGQENTGRRDAFYRIDRMAQKSRNTIELEFSLLISKSSKAFGEKGGTNA